MSGQVHTYCKVVFLVSSTEEGVSMRPQVVEEEEGAAD